MKKSTFRNLVTTTLLLALGSSAVSASEEGKLVEAAGRSAYRSMSSIPPLELGLQSMSLAGLREEAEKQKLIHNIADMEHKARCDKEERILSLAKHHAEVRQIQVGAVMSVQERNARIEREAIELQKGRRENNIAQQQATGGILTTIKGGLCGYRLDQQPQPIPGYQGYQAGAEGAAALAREFGLIGPARAPLIMDGPLIRGAALPATIGRARAPQLQLADVPYSPIQERKEEPSSSKPISKEDAELQVAIQKSLEGPSSSKPISKEDAELQVAIQKSLEEPSSSKPISKEDAELQVAIQKSLEGPSSSKPISKEDAELQAAIKKSLREN